MLQGVCLLQPRSHGARRIQLIVASCARRYIGCKVSTGVQNWWGGTINYYMRYERYTPTYHPTRRYCKTYDALKRHYPDGSDLWKPGGRWKGVPQSYQQCQSICNEIPKCNAIAFYKLQSDWKKWGSCIT